MTYFITAEGLVYAYDDEQLAMGYPFDPMRLMTPEEVELHLNPPPTPEEIRAAAVTREDLWRVSEIQKIKDNLDAILFEDPDALPGTEAQWKAYGVKVTKWKEGNVDFPDSAKRPVRPQ